MLKPSRLISKRGDAPPPDEPNKLLASDYGILDRDPLIGILFLLTDEGEHEMYLNKAVARQLVGNLKRFLDGVDPPEIPPESGPPDQRHIR